MVEMKRILFLTDFSSEADAALQYAKALATEFDGRLYLLHVIVDPTSKLYQMTSGDYHALDRNAREKAQEWLTRIQREHLGNSSQCETLIERGELFDMCSMPCMSTISMSLPSVRIHTQAFSCTSFRVYQRSWCGKLHATCL